MKIPETTTTSLKPTSIDVSDVIINLSTVSANQSFIKRIRYDDISKKVLFDLVPPVSEGIIDFTLKYGDSTDNINNSSNVVKLNTATSSFANFSFQIEQSDINDRDNSDNVCFYVKISTSVKIGYAESEKTIQVTINNIYTLNYKQQIKTIDLYIDKDQLKDSNVTYKKELDRHIFKGSKSDLLKLTPKVICTTVNSYDNPTLTDIYNSNESVAILENNFIKFTGDTGSSFIDFKLNGVDPDPNTNNYYNYIKYFTSDKGPTLKITVEDLGLNEYLSEHGNTFKFNDISGSNSTAEADCEFLFELFTKIPGISKITKDDANIIFDDVEIQISFNAEFKKIDDNIIYIYNSNTLYGFLLKNDSGTAQVGAYYEPYYSAITYSAEKYGDINNNITFNGKQITITCNISIYNYIDTGYIKESGKYNDVKIILKNNTDLIPSKTNTYRLKIQNIIEEIGDIDLYNSIKNSTDKNKQLNYYIRLNSHSSKLKYHNFYITNANDEYDLLADNYVKNIEDDIIIYSTYKLVNDELKHYGNLGDYEDSLIINIPTEYNNSIENNIELSLYFDLCVTEKSTEYNNINNFKFNIKYTDNKKIIKRISINSPVIETVEYENDNDNYPRKALRFRLPKSYFDNIIDNYKDIYKLLSISYSSYSSSITNNVALYQYINDYNIVKYNNTSKDAKIIKYITIKVDNRAVNRVYVQNNKDYILYVEDPHGKCNWSFNVTYTSSNTNTEIPANNTDPNYVLYIKEYDMLNNELNNKIKLAVKLPDNIIYKINIICQVDETSIYKSASSIVRFETKSNVVNTLPPTNYGYSVNNGYPPSSFPYNSIEEAILYAKHYIFYNNPHDGTYKIIIFDNNRVNREIVYYKPNSTDVPPPLPTPTPTATPPTATATTIDDSSSNTN